jgi:hypothetical protein
MIQTTQDISTQSKPLIAELADFIGQVEKGSTNQMLRFRIFQIFRICTLRSGNPYTQYISNIFILFYKEFHNRFECSESPKCVEFNTPPNAIKLKLKTVNFGNSIMRMTSFMTPTK